MKTNFKKNIAVATLATGLSACGGGSGGGSPQETPVDLTRQEASSALEQQLGGFTPDTTLSDTSLGVFEDAQGNRAQLEYTSALSSTQSSYNANPDGQAGGVNCFKAVTPTSQIDVGSISTQGCLPFEVVQSSQVNSFALKQATSASPQAIVQNYSCDTQGCESVGLNGFKVEGEVAYVQCDSTSLSKLQESGRMSQWGLTSSEAMSYGNDFSIENCTAYRSVDSTQGNSLEGKITGTWNFADTQAPQITIQDVSYTTTLQDGSPRDVGDVCVQAIAQDNDDGDVTPSVDYALKSLNGQLEQTTYSSTPQGAACFSLGDFGGLESQVQITAQDSAGNQRVATTSSFTPDVNTTGAYQSGGGNVECFTNETITLPQVSFAQDPQGDAARQGYSVGSSSFTCPSTPQTLNYLAFQEDTFGAKEQSPSYTITVTRTCDPNCGNL